MSDDNFTIMVRNLSTKVTEELLHELFLQAGPLDRIRIPSSNGVQKNFGFVVFKHEVSVPYAMQLFANTSLFGRLLSLKTRAEGVSKMNKSLIRIPVQERIGFRKDAAPVAKTSMGKRLLDKSMMPSGPSKSRHKRDSDVFRDPWRDRVPSIYPSQNSNIRQYWSEIGQRIYESSRQNESRIPYNRYERSRNVYK